MLDKKIKELTLLLLYLASWEEKIADTKVRRSWKGYPFETLDKLAEEGYISGGKKAKSVHIFEKGIKEGRKLKRRYLKD